MDAATFTDTSDLCQQLLDRYGNSTAPQHRHLCAIAAANRSIIQSESLPLTPFSYFAATISTLSDQTQLDQEGLAALSSFLSIVLPLVPEKAIAPDKAKEAVEVLAQKVSSSDAEVSLGTANARTLIKSLGLLVGFCNLDDWESVEFGFNTLLNFSIGKRPKVFIYSFIPLTTVLAHTAFLFLIMCLVCPHVLYTSLLLFSGGNCTVVPSMAVYTDGLMDTKRQVEKDIFQN